MATLSAGDMVRTTDWNHGDLETDRAPASASVSSHMWYYGYGSISIPPGTLLTILTSETKFNHAYEGQRANNAWFTDYKVVCTWLDENNVLKGCPIRVGLVFWVRSLHAWSRPVA